MLSARLRSVAGVVLDDRSLMANRTRTARALGVA
jgi:hypothetical protein